MTRRRSSFGSAGGAAIEGAAQGEHGDYDDQLHRSHDHRDRRGHRIVVLLEGGGVSGDGDDPRRPGRGAPSSTADGKTEKAWTKQRQKVIASPGARSGR